MSLCIEREGDEKLGKPEKGDFTEYIGERVGRKGRDLQTLRAMPEFEEIIEKK